MMEETSFIKNMTAHILEIPDLEEYVVLVLSSFLA